MAIETKEATLTGNELVILKILVALKKGGDVENIRALLKELQEGKLKTKFEKRIETLEKLEALGKKEKETHDSVFALFKLFPALESVSSLWDKGGPNQKIDALELCAFKEVSSLLERIYVGLPKDCLIFLEGWPYKNVGKKLAMLERHEVQKELAKISFDVELKTFIAGVDALDKQIGFLKEKRLLKQQRQKDLGECATELVMYITDSNFVDAIVGEQGRVTDLLSLRFDPAIESLFKKRRVKKACGAQQKKIGGGAGAAEEDSTKDMLDALGGSKKEKKPVYYSIAVGVRWLFAEAFPLLVIAIAHRFSHKRMASKGGIRRVIEVELPPQEEEPVSVCGRQNKP
ncbi:MAG: hypothetical protein KKI20_00910 [Gammaproteobacteria bacterium]|nr:hypothetical protein [Gammaproteobacteria bacterium]